MGGPQAQQFPHSPVHPLLGSSFAGNRVVQAWEGLELWTGVRGGVPEGEEAGAGLTARAPWGALGEGQMLRGWTLS